VWVLLFCLINKVVDGSHVLDDMNILFLVLELGTFPNLLEVEWVTLDLLDWTVLEKLFPIVVHLDLRFLVIPWLHVLTVFECCEEILEHVTVVWRHGITHF
jgi:hypothetical protein